MWLEKIIEAKQAQRISTKAISERTKSRIPEQTITRILTRKTQTPRIDTVLEIGEAVGLSVEDLFAETISVVGGKTLSALQAEFDALKEENERLIAEHAVIKKEKTLLEERIERLRSTNEELTEQVIMLLKKK